MTDNVTAVSIITIEIESPLNFNTIIINKLRTSNLNMFTILEKTKITTLDWNFGNCILDQRIHVKRQVNIQKLKLQKNIFWILIIL